MSEAVETILALIGLCVVAFCVVYALTWGISACVG